MGFISDLDKCYDFVFEGDEGFEYDKGEMFGVCGSMYDLLGNGTGFIPIVGVGVHL